MRRQESTRDFYEPLKALVRFGDPSLRVWRGGRDGSTSLKLKRQGLIFLDPYS